MNFGTDFGYPVLAADHYLHQSVVAVHGYWVGRSGCVCDLCVCVCVCVHALKGKWLQLSTPKLVDISSKEGQGLQTVCVYCMAGPACVGMLIGLLRLCSLK